MNLKNHHVAEVQTLTFNLKLFEKMNSINSLRITGSFIGCISCSEAFFFLLLNQATGVTSYHKMAELHTECWTGTSVGPG